MKLFDEVKRRLGRAVGRAEPNNAARADKAKSDSAADAVATGAQADLKGEDGSSVGLTAPQFDAEVQESGAEARSEATRRSNTDRT